MFGRPGVSLRLRYVDVQQIYCFLPTALRLDKTTHTIVYVKC